MTTISHPSPFCTVIVTIDAAPDVIGEMEPHAKSGLTWFAGFDGLVSGALHKSNDGSRLVQYLQWESEADHLACMQDPRWDDLPSAARFMEFVNAGRATMDVRTYTVLATSDT